MYIKNRNNQPTASGLFRMVSDNKKGRARLPFLQNQETAFLRPERLVQSARPASPVPLRQRLRELFRRNGSGSEYRKNEQGRTAPFLHSPISRHSMKETKSSRWISTVTEYRFAGIGNVFGKHACHRPPGYISLSNQALHAFRVG